MTRPILSPSEWRRATALGAPVAVAAEETQGPCPAERLARLIKTHVLRPSGAPGRARAKGDAK
ncbi:MAG: hypothetical protein AAGC57_00995 [Pseudomonadota bacterium]